MKIHNHVKSVFIILITIVIMAILEITKFDTSKNLDFAFFLMCTFFLIALFAFGWMLFRRGKKETCLVTVFCSFSLIISLHKLHHISTLTREVRNFNIFSPYMITLGIVVVIAIILSLIKCGLQSSEITKNTSENSKLDDEETPPSLPKHNSDGNSAGYKITIVIVDIILILAISIGFYFIHGFISANTPLWQEAIIVIVGIPVLLYVSLWFAKEILNLFKYKNNRSELLSKVKTYWLSLIITGILEYFGYKNGFASGLFKNFASTDLGNFIAFPLTLILILITTLLLAQVIHKILSDFMNVEEDKVPSDKRIF